MNKTVFFLMLTLAGALALASFDSSAKDPKPTAPEYLTIVYKGRHDTYALFPDGKAQFMPELANIPRIERVEDQQLAMHTLINKFANEGYEYVDTPEPSRVIMKKKTSF